MNCWKCNQPLENLLEKIKFRQACVHCDASLHACRQCHYYAPGKPNDCIVPGTEFVRDREASNFCEEFKVKTGSSEPSKNIQNFHRLFKESCNY